MSERVQRLLAVVRADVLIRLRRPSTAVVFLLLAVLPYLWIPSPSTGRGLIVINGQRVLYNSAAIGMATAILGTIFIGLAGYYVVSNALRRDVVSRCGFVIASTTMRGSEYIVGKFAGNVAFLTLFVLGYMATAMAMVLVRGEAPLEPFVFIRQYLIMLPPSIVFVSAVAILFECTPLLRTKFGDVLYFFLWLSVMGMTGSAMEKNPGLVWPMYFDVSGLGVVMLQVNSFFHTHSVAIGSSTFNAAKGTLTFPGLSADARWLLPRVTAMIWPLALLAVARVFFHRFDPARVRAVADKGRRSWIGRFNALAKPFTRLFVRAAQAMVSVSGRPSLLRSSITDALTTMAAFPLATFGVIGFAIAAIASDAKGLLTGVMPIAFAGCAIVIADIACREKRAGTSALVFATPQLRARFVMWKFASGLIVATAFLAVPLARAIALQPASALPLAIGVVFTTAAATAFGIVSSNPKTFIVGFLTFWYITLSDKGITPSLDFAGWFGTATPVVLASYAGAALLLLGGAQLFHARELRRRW